MRSVGKRSVDADPIELVGIGPSIFALVTQPRRVSTKACLCWPRHERDAVGSKPDEMACMSLDHGRPRTADDLQGTSTPRDTRAKESARSHHYSHLGDMPLTPGQRLFSSPCKLHCFAPFCNPANDLVLRALNPAQTMAFAVQRYSTPPPFIPAALTRSAPGLFSFAVVFFAACCP